MAAKKTSKKKAAKRRTKAHAKKKASSKKAPRKKAAGKRHPLKPGKAGKKPTLDRRIYAEARGRGASKAEAARLAGSKARTTQAQTQAGTKIEADPLIADLIEAVREAVIIREIKDPWEKSKAVMQAMLDHPEWRARGTASNFFGKVVGGYAPDKVEHSGSIETAAVGEVGNLSKKERAELRALLKKRA